MSAVVPQEIDQIGQYGYAGEDDDGVLDHGHSSSSADGSRAERRPLDDWF
jgi:hypothetical protein